MVQKVAQTLRATDEVRACASIHHHGVRGSSAALILLQFRPQASVIPSAIDTLQHAIMDKLAKLGWESPAVFLRGGHLATRGKLGVQGNLDRGDLHLLTIDNDLMYGGPIPRPPLWAQIARKAGSIGVLACADPALDHLDFATHAGQLAEDGKVLAAAGLFVQEG